MAPICSTRAASPCVVLPRRMEDPRGSGRNPSTGRSTRLPESVIAGRNPALEARYPHFWTARSIPLPSATISEYTPRLARGPCRPGRWPAVGPERHSDALPQTNKSHQEDPQAGLSCAHEDQCRKEDHQPPASPWPFDQCSLSDSPSARRPSSNIEETLTNHDRLNRTNRGPGRTSRIRKEHRGRDACRRARGPLS